MSIIEWIGFALVGVILAMAIYLQLKDRKGK